MKVGRQLVKEDPFAKVNAKLARFRQAVETILQQKRNIARDISFTCEHCGRKAPLSQWVFIQSMYYVAPHGCTEGDYWVNSQTKVCHLCCPMCEWENYLYNHPEREKILGVFVEVGESQKEMIFARIEIRRK
ncbi:hypothetical protein IPJ70_03175 [Candidatus Campbellbacteria bacterium]|nr:MAG: hypothetical protein IPJ70_03175 [Candidatus Campbellbacteria bacterium]